MGKWRELNPSPTTYNIQITYTDNIGIRHTAFISVEGNVTKVEYNQLIPQQQYTCCVFGIYTSYYTSIGCNNFQANPSSNTTASKSTSNPNPSPSPDSLNNNSTPIVGGVLGVVIAVLVLLLVVAGVGLAYLQCVRSRGKDNSR